MSDENLVPGGESGLELDAEDELALDRAWAGLQREYAADPEGFMADFEEDIDSLPVARSIFSPAKGADKAIG